MSPGIHGVFLYMRSFFLSFRLFFFSSCRPLHPTALRNTRGTLTPFAGTWLHGRGFGGGERKRGEGLPTTLKRMTDLQWDKAPLLSLKATAIRHFHDAFLLTPVRFSFGVALISHPIQICVLRAFVHLFCLAFCVTRPICKNAASSLVDSSVNAVSLVLLIFGM